MLKTLSLTLVLSLSACLSTADVMTYNNQVMQWYQADNNLINRLQLYNAQHQLSLLATIGSQKMVTTELDGYRLRYTTIWQDVSQYETANQTNFKALFTASAKNKMPDLSSIIAASSAESAKIDAFIAAEDAHLKALTPPGN